jgi:hypothetical protein
MSERRSDLASGVELSALGWSYETERYAMRDRPLMFSGVEHPSFSF